MQKSLLNKTIHDLTVKDGFKLYILTNLVVAVTTAMVKSIQNGDFKFSTNKEVGNS